MWLIGRFGYSLEKKTELADMLYQCGWLFPHKSLEDYQNWAMETNMGYLHKHRSSEAGQEHADIVFLIQRGLKFQDVFFDDFKLRFSILTRPRRRLC